MMKYVAGLVLGFVMLVSGTNEASAQTCAGGVCKVAKAVVSAPVNLVKEVQPVKRVVNAPVRVKQWVASNRPVRSLFGRVTKRGCGC